jgi:ferrous iron transport protein B
LNYFPRAREITDRYNEQRAAAEAELEPRPLAERLAVLDRLEAGEHQRNSYFAGIGHALEPVFRPLGWDWRIGMAVLASFPAREVVISTLGIVYDLGADVDLDDEASRGLLIEKLHASTWPDGRKVFSLPVALSIMVFFALCCQCGATLVTVKRETHSWKWALFTFTYMTALAYLAALATYQVGSRLA